MKSPLSQSQLGVYYACETSVSDACNYQNPALFPLPQDIDIPCLQRAVYEAICAHPYMTSHLDMQDDEVQCVEGIIGSRDQTVPIREVNEAEWQVAQKNFAATMDIHGEKLYRAEIYVVERRETKDESYLYLDIHHVLADGFSMTILLRDIERLYNGKKASGEMMDGAAIALAEKAQRADEAMMTEAREWYAKTFCDAADTDSLPIPQAELALLNQPAQIVYKHYPLTFTKEEVQAIQKRFGSKESIIMQCAWAQLLASYSAEEKASYCTAFWGRTDRRTLSSITMMVHTLPVFVQTNAETTIAELLESTDAQLQQTQRYQYYAYPDAVQDLGLNNQVMFVYQGAVLADKRGLHLGETLVPVIDLRQPTPGWKLCAELFESEGQYSLKMSYSSADYSEEFMAQMAESYSMIILSMVSAERVSEISLCNTAQLQWLNDRNPKSLPNPKEGDTLVGRFKHFAATQPDAICVVSGDTRLTYAEVDRLTDTINPQYTERCGEHVIGYSVPRNEQMVLVPLSIAKAGMTAMPLDSSYPAERLDYMRADAAKYKGEGAFILLYTSGTTGIPKGVMLSESNILTFCDYHVPHIGLTNQSRYATYAGYGFDAFMHDLWGVLCAGAAMYVITDDIRFDLEALHDYFVKEDITHTFMTTQVATQMVQNYPDIPSLQFLGTGGEKLMSLNPPHYRLQNGYGPTETTVYVTSFSVEKNEPNIPIGYPNDSAEVFIVNKYGHRVPWGAAGELYIAGPQVGIGYLNQPEKTEEAFVELKIKNYELQDPKTTTLRCYRTGDIVRYRQDGAIEFVGRKDGQVKIRGFRIELKEVESVIRQFEGIKDATVQAFDFPEGGGKFIAAYVVSDAKIDIEALNAFILDQKPPYMVPTVTMQIDAIPLNQNQKVNKRALPEPKAAISNQPSEVSAPLNVLEEQLKQIITDIVGNSDFGLTTDLRYVGLSSISAIKLATQVYKRFGVQLDAKLLVKGASLQAIENEILKSMLESGIKSQESRANVFDEKGQDTPSLLHSFTPYPLSHAQTGVYFECMKNPTSTLYNIPMRARLPLEISDDELREAVEQIVNNHPELFVRFRTDEAGVIQEPRDKGLWSKEQVALIRLQESETDTYRTEFVQPFNLSNDLLFRFAIVRTEKALYLYSDIHHLVCDGGSYHIFFEELCTLLNSGGIEAEMCSYSQFVAEEKEAENGAEYKAAKEFFHSRLAEVEGPTEIPADLTNPTDGEIGQVYAPMDFEAAKRLAQTAGATPAGVTLAAVFYTLSRFANTDELCITTISNGRSNLKIANTMGMFVNTLALSQKIGNQDVLAFISESGEQFEQTLQHEYYPFAQVAADYDLTAEIMYAYQIGVLADYRVRGHRIETESMELNVPKFKIAFYIVEVNGQPSVAIEYDNGRYSREMMQSLAQAVSNAISAFDRDCHAQLRSISLLNEAQIELLDHFNETTVEYDKSQTILSLFKAQVAKTPENIAVIFRDQRFTYRELDEITDRIAANLHPTTGVIAIKVERSAWMPIGALAVLKTGCAYLPLDPSYPEERLQYMQKDAQSCILLTEKELEELSNSEAVLQQGGQIRPEDLFILLYTSGSTGVPKGVMLEHGNLVAFCHWYHRYYDLHEDDKVAAYASFGFDACMMDMYPALTRGAAVVIVPEDMRLNLPELGQYFDEVGVTHSFMTTQIGFQFATNVECHSLKHLSVGGEALSALTPPTNYTLHNGYGPTECTIFTTIYPLSKYEQHIPIGKPLDNLQLYVMDTNGQRLPLGAAGELWVSGPQVSRGYLNLPERTAESFVELKINNYELRDHETTTLTCYRTGDIVRYLPDGNIQFVGRRDGQVKIRGFRIELKEVETVIRQFPDIQDATVQAFDYPNGGKYIAAYVVSDKQIDIHALHAFIRESKPPYMVPAATMQIDAIPLNQNQKVNRKALPSPVLSKADGNGAREYIAPANATEQLFADIFASILMIDKVGATDNFFELGGTSLMVTRVIIEADKAGKHIAYADLFAHPTPRDLATLINGGEVSNNEQITIDHEIADFDYSAINDLLRKNNLSTFLQGEKTPLGRVLLTGATGYLGIHVLRELIDADTPAITCLIRGKSQQDAERRLRTLLFYYFDQRFDDLFGKRLFVINGDVTSEIVAENIDTVFNCAANVKHFSKGTDIEDVNIGGAQQCVEFCLKHNARLVHVSTTSTGGLWMDDSAPAPVLSEQNIYFGQYLGNQYMHSKFLADRLILNAVATRGLHAKIMRVGNLAARSYDGEFQVNFQTNSYMGRLKVYKTLGCCPYDQYDQPTEFSPINETARAIVLLATTPDGCTVFQPYNTHTRLLGDVLQSMNVVGTNIELVETNEFGLRMQQAAADPKKAAVLTTMLAYKGIGHGKSTIMIDRNNAYTSQVLLRLGFRWTEPNTEYINRMLAAIGQLGFFDN